MYSFIYLFWVSELHSTIILVSHAHILVDSGAGAMCDCGRGYYQSLFTYVDNFNKQINKKHMKNNDFSFFN